ncbi:MAG: hypothetical protein AAGG01_23170 [Planctomycetota bacterium]
MTFARRPLRSLTLGLLAACAVGGGVLHGRAQAAWDDVKADASAARSRLIAAPTTREPLFAEGIDGSAFAAYAAASSALLGDDPGDSGERVREFVQSTRWSEDPDELKRRRAFVEKPRTQEALRLLREGARSRDKRSPLDWTRYEDLPRLSGTYALVRTAVAQASLLTLEGRDEEAAAWHLDAAQAGVDLLGGRTAVTSAIGFSAITWALHDDDGSAGECAHHGRRARYLIMEAARTIDSELTFDPLLFDGELALSVAFLRDVEDEKGVAAFGWRSALDLPSAVAPLMVATSARDSLTSAFEESDARGYAAFHELVHSYEQGGVKSKTLAPLYSVQCSRLYTRSKLRAIAAALAMSLEGSLPASPPVDALGVAFDVEESDSAWIVRSQGDAYTELSVRVSKLRGQ